MSGNVIRNALWTTSSSEGRDLTGNESIVSAERGVYRPERLGLVAVTIFPREVDVVAPAVV
jgi:hypothetical protein